MKILIENNSFTMDTREARYTRLNKLHKNIEKYSQELKISHELLNWAIYSFEEYNNLLSELTDTTIKKNDSFNIISTIEKEYFQKFNSLKDLILKQHNNHLHFKDFETQLSTTRIDKIEFASNFMIYIKSNSAVKLDKMSQNALEIMIPQIEKVKKTYGDALNYQELQTNISKRIKKRFNQDSLNLRNIYNLCIVYWNKKDPRLLDLAFALPKIATKNPNTPDEILKNKYKDNKFQWEKESKSQYFQLVFRNKFNSADWRIIYEGIENYFLVEIEHGEYKVRGMNGYGFGLWSKSIIFNEDKEQIIC